MRSELKAEVRWLVTAEAKEKVRGKVPGRGGHHLIRESARLTLGLALIWLAGVSASGGWCYHTEGVEESKGQKDGVSTVYQYSNSMGYKLGFDLATS